MIPLPKLNLRSIREKNSIKDDVCIIGVRGCLKSLGSPELNDRGIYDDAIYLVIKDSQTAFKANTDPSRYSPGMAYLLPGIWTYRLGIHGLSKPVEQQYGALVQASVVYIKRDGVVGEERGFFGINIHKGGYSTTGSEGCQTIHPDQWDGFINAVKLNMAFNRMETIKYLLMDVGSV